MVERIRSRRRRIMKEFVIREVSAVDSPAQKHALAVLMKRDDEQQESDMQLQKITRVGFTRDADAPISFSTLEDAMEHLRKVHGMTGLDAMEHAARRHPELVKRYNDEGEAVAKAAAEEAAPRPASKAVVDFEERVADVMARDRCSKLDAMERARVEFPEAFAKYQEA